MKSKEEAVKKAYESLGMIWNEIKNLVTESGVLTLPTPDYKYSLTGYENLIKDKGHFLSFGSEGLKLMPSKLIGLHNNNGWIKIESIEDMPILDKYKNLDVEIGMIWQRRLDGFIYIDDIKCLTHDNHTHYMFIPMVKPPIY